MTANRAWWADAVALGAAAVGAAVTAIFCAPANSWLDSAELTACAAELGNIHPPGHPAWLSLAPLLRLLPIGPFAWRVAVFSALCAGASAFLLVRLTRAHLGDHGTRALTSVWALLAAATLLVSSSLWQVTVRAEVYTLALATNLWALHAALLAGKLARFPQPDPRLLLGYIASWMTAVCLGLLNHHYVALFALPGSLLAVWPALMWLLRRHRRVALILLLAGAWLGLGYGALALRAHADTEMRWGDPTSLAGLWDTVTAKQFQKGVTQAHVDVLENLMILGGMVAQGLSLPLAALGLLGLALGVLWRDRTQLVIWLTFLGALLTKAILQIDTHNPDDHGYVLMAPAMLALGVGQLAAFLSGRQGILAQWPELRRLRLARILLGLALLLAGAQLLDNTQNPPTNLAHLRAADTLDAHLRAELPPGALYVANYYGLAFNEQAFRVAEGRRPDVAAMHLSMRTGDTDHGHAWQTWFAVRHPDLQDLSLGAQKLGRPPVGNLLERAETQPIYAEQDPDLRIPPPYFSFDGIAQRLVTARERSIEYDVSEILARHQRIWTELDAAIGPKALLDAPTKAVLLWQHALQLAHALRRGWLTVAKDELQRAQLLNQGDRLLTRLAQRTNQLDAAFHAGDAKQFRALWQHWSRMDFDQLASDAP